MIEPVFVYYKLTNFYGNFRNYVISRDQYQLYGDDRTLNQLKKSCGDALYVKDVFKNNKDKYFTYDNKPLKETDVAIPCGLVAKSYFQDKFSFSLVSDDKSLTSILVNETNISDYYDFNYNFNNRKDSQSTQWLDLKDGKI